MVNILYSILVKIANGKRNEKGFFRKKTTKKTGQGKFLIRQEKVE